MKRPVAIMFAVLFLMLSGAPARPDQGITQGTAQGTAQKVARNIPQEITIVRGQDFPPYHYLDENGHEKGFLIDLIRKAGSRLNLSVRFWQLPWSRCLYMVRSGQADAMMNLFKTDERTVFMAFSDTPLTHEVNRLFTLKKSNFQFFGDLAVLRGVKLGAVRNYSYGEAFDRITDQVSILRLETEKALIMNLTGQRCDVIIGNEVVIKVLAGQLGVSDRIRPAGPKITDAPLYIGFSRARGHEHLAEAFSGALEAVKASPAYRKLLDSYQR